MIALWRHCRPLIFAFSLLGGTLFFPSASFAQSSEPPATATEPTKVPTLYEVGYSHLDTEWCWTYPQVVNEFVKNTLDDNFALFDKYPDYTFNWTGANRYKFMKEYYPSRYARLKKYVAQGRWVNTGSSLEEGDVCIPSEESIIRQVLYGNEFFNNEFHSSSNDFILPDCFGFPASLPSILAHCGVIGFSTQKLTWGSAVGIPFNLGLWVGPDGQSIFAALNGGDYGKPLANDASNDRYWIDRINQDGKLSGIYADYNYYGVGDRGGSVRESDAADLETSIHGTGPLHVVSARSDQVFNDLTHDDTHALPRYQGDLLLTWHNCGSATSQAEQKRWNHENEKLADATERASVVADWLGALPYDKPRITDAWWKFLPGQFHDLMAGTAIPLAYTYAWNDQVLAMNELSGQLAEAVGGVTRGLDTLGPGLPVVIYNSLSISRQDIASATVQFSRRPPSAISVVGPDGSQVPSQVTGRSKNSVSLLFLATVPSVGFSTYFVRAGASRPAANELHVSTSLLENARYRVQINSAGDIASIYDKRYRKELLAAPLRISFQHENPSQYPAWNMDWLDQSRRPRGYVDGPAKVAITENGPARVSVSVDRWARGSHFIQTVQLSSGQAGDRVEFHGSIDWKSTESALKVIMPFTVSNPLATYNWELGTIQRTTDDPKKYEVPSHQWFDLTDNRGSYGITVLSGDRYGSDKPTDNTLRLTLLYTPGVQGGFVHQKTNDWGHHELSFAIAGHPGRWTAASSQWTAMRFDRPLIAFQTQSHDGVLGTSFSFVHTNTNNVSVEAMKQAESSHEIVVRFNELAGQTEDHVLASFATPVVAARQVNGQEAPLGPATVMGGKLVFAMSAYRPVAFAVRLAPPAVSLSAPISRTITLPYNVNVTKPFGSASSGSFDNEGNAIPADMLPKELVSDGISFHLASGDGPFNAVACRGQKITAPAGPNGAKIYLLAAASDGDANVSFKVGNHATSLMVQAWNGMIGQWDNRLWGGIVPELSYNIDNPMIGLEPGFIKRDTVAWYSDHIRGATGENQVYKYCYLFRYSIDDPEGNTTLTLPNNPRVKILAATLAVDPNQSTAPAQPLYDTLQFDDQSANDPHIVSTPAANGEKVKIDEPLYFNSTSTLHYTLDGSAPNASSAVYTVPFTVTSPTIVRAAYIDAVGSVTGSTKTKVWIRPRPSITAATAPRLAFQLDASQSFDGRSSSLSKAVTGLPTDAESAWTINLFAYFTETPAELTTLGGFGDDQDTSGTQRYIIKFHDGIHFWGSNVDITTGVPYDLNKWQMVTATYDGTTLNIYKNAVLIKSADISLDDAAGIVNIAPPGPWPGAGKLSGRIAGFRIYNGALTGDQITALLSQMPKE